jgi:hypothetical protein
LVENNVKEKNMKGDKGAPKNTPTSKKTDVFAFMAREALKDPKKMEQYIGFFAHQILGFIKKSTRITKYP